MKNLFLIFFFLVGMAVSGLQAQATWSPDGLTLKYVAYDFYSPVTDGTSPTDLKNLTGGFEIGYHRNINKWLNIGVPLRMGRAEFPLGEGEFTEQRLFGSFDALLQFHLMEPDWWIAPYAIGGAGAILDTEGELTVQYPVGGGLNFKLGDGYYLQAQTEYRIDPRDETTNWAHSFGLLILLDAPDKMVDTDGDGIEDSMDDCPLIAGVAAFNGCPDSDGDGIADKEDDCPDVAGALEFAGCPDSDGDGIADKDDACPDEAGLKATNGCPDRDGDGVIDKEDECPDEAGTARYNGCPPPPADADNDGVPDKDDDCPTQAGTAELNGCPDRDGDGVADREDRCPDSAGPASNRGCPEIEEEEKEKLEFATQAVEFETGSNRLKEGSKTLLNDIADLMNKYTDYSLRIGGHTDSQGSAAFNQQLSEKRAKACYDYLISQGVAAARMSYTGYGEEKPIADNRYADGRAQNRRVEFDMYLE